MLRLVTKHWNESRCLKFLWINRWNFLDLSMASSTWSCTMKRLISTSEKVLKWLTLTGPEKLKLSGSIATFFRLTCQRNWQRFSDFENIYTVIACAFGGSLLNSRFCFSTIWTRATSPWWQLAQMKFLVLTSLYFSSPCVNGRIALVRTAHKLAIITSHAHNHANMCGHSNYKQHLTTVEGTKIPLCNK